MKKFFAILTCFALLSAVLPLSLSAVGVPIDSANFPDPVFRDYVQKFDLNRDGALSETECAAVTEILISEISSDTVFSLTGIKNFTNLENLHCGESNLNELDLSGFTHLKYLYCSQNNLKTLNLSGCSSLGMLNCQFNQLTQIDLTGCSSLGSILCNHNRLTELDVSNCPLLETLSIYENRIAAIDVSKNNKLLYFTVVPQTVSAQKTQKSGKWTVDLGALVGKSNLGKVTVDTGFLNVSTGIVTFDSDPVQFGYTYKSSNKYGMDVIITLYKGGPPVLTADNLSFDPRDTAFDALKEPGLNLSAVDTEDGNLTASVKAQVKTVATWGSAASNAVVAYNTIPLVNTKTPGLYIIEYVVTDSDGNKTVSNVYITVRNDGSMSSMQSGPASILPPAPNTASGPIVSINNDVRSDTDEPILSKTSDLSTVLSAESDMTTPPMGAPDSGITLILVLILASASAILIIAKRRQKAIDTEFNNRH